LDSDSDQTFTIIELRDENTDYIVEQGGKEVLRITGGRWVYGNKGARMRYRNTLFVSKNSTNLFCFRKKMMTMHGTWRLENACNTAKGSSGAIANFRRSNQESVGIGAVYTLCRGSTQVLRATEKGVSMKILLTDYAGEQVACADIASVVEGVTGNAVYTLRTKPNVDALMCILAVVYIDIV